MRFLLISDTHGDLEVINRLAAMTQSDAVIHSGDFGFYDVDSFERLSDRELRLQIKHSFLPQAEKDATLELPRSGIVRVAQEHCLLGSFQDYIDARRSFNIPVHAVWGNHEDKAVVERLCRGQIAIHNLHILHARQIHRFGTVVLYGLGGNFLPGTKMLHKSIAGGCGKIWATLTEYAELVATLDRESEHEACKIFVSHVSPGKEAFVEFIAARTGATYTVSGHMGAPNCMVWNPFAISTVDEAIRRVREGFYTVKQACVKASVGRTTVAEAAFHLIGKMSGGTDSMETQFKEPWWYRGMTHINLPDAAIGYATMDIDGPRIHLQSSFTETQDQ